MLKLFQHLHGKITLLKEIPVSEPKGIEIPQHVLDYLKDKQLMERHYQDEDGHRAVVVAICEKI